VEDLTRRDLIKQLRVLRERQSALIGRRSDEDTFPAWVLLATATRNAREAAESECGGSDDGMNDAIFIDPNAPLIWIVQGKFRKTVMGDTEKAKDIYDFARLMEKLHEGETDSSEPAYWSRLRRNEKAYELFTKASALVREKSYTTRLLFASLWKFDKTITGNAAAIVAQTDKQATIQCMGWADIKRLLAYYLRNAAPGPPRLTLEVASGNPTRDKMGSDSLEARVFSSTGEQVAKLLADGGEPIFARNIRLGLGDKVKVNAAIKRSITEDPATFWYLNNGLTIACSKASYDADGGAITIDDLHIINGQQTTRTLYGASEEGVAVKRGLGRLQVGIRLIEVPPEDPESDAVIDKIVEATNFQNAINQADLRTNDVEQIDLERDLGARGYDYVRKRGKTDLSLRKPAFAHLQTKVPMKVLATAVAGALHESVPLREGNRLFNPELPYYNEIFKGGRSLDFLLMCFWLWTHVGKRASGNSNRQAAKYVVHFDMYRSNGGTLRRYAKEFVRAFELKNKGVVEPLEDAIDAEFDVAVSSFHANRSSRSVTIKPYHQNVDMDAYANFQRHWDKDSAGKAQMRYEDAVTALRAALRASGE
jgi:hypothetical protein